MKPYKYIAGAMLTLLGCIATGCNDSDEWKPGPEDTSIGVSAYFDKPTTTSYIFDSTASAEDMQITVPVVRQHTENEATVGLTLTSDTEGFTAPPSVTFGAGIAVATVTIGCDGISKGTTHSVTLTLAEDQTDIYGPGMHEVTFSVIKADWRLLCDRARYLYSNLSYDPIYPATYGELYQLEGTKTFKLTDFFGSGLDITFECKTGGPTVLYPQDNANFEDVSDANKEYQGWYLYDEANSSWPTWTPGDVEGYPAISYLLFYADSYYNYCQMIYNTDTLYGYIGLTVGIDFDDYSFQWGNFQVDFNLEYNPFE